MAQKVIREKTKIPSIYFNKSTGRYDVKYNYKEYDPIQGKNVYKAKWKYTLRTLAEAKDALARLQTGAEKTPDKDITLEGIYQVWLREAEADGYSVVTVRNTEQQLRMIYQFLPPETKLKNITSDVYTDLIAKARAKQYAEETLHNINACFRKLMKLAWKKEYIRENPLDRVANKRFQVKKKHDEFSPHLITKAEFKEIDEYFANNSFMRLGVDRYKGYRLMVNFLYYSGLRIGELLALTFADVDPVLYYKGKKIDEGDWFEYDMYHEPDPDSFDGFQLIVNKVLLSNGDVSRYEDRIRGQTKNKKNRVVPLSKPATDLYLAYLQECRARGGGHAGDRVFPWTASNSLTMVRTACKKTGIRHHSLHDFRHTFISNMLDAGLSLAQVELFSGDDQTTILQRYSHANNDSKKALVDAMNNL